MITRRPAFEPLAFGRRQPFLMETAAAPAPRLSDVVAFGRLLVEAGLMALIPLAAAALVLLAWA